MPVLGAGGKLKLRRQPVDKTLYLDQTRVDTTCNKIKGAPSWLWNGDHIAGINLPIYCDDTGTIPGRVSGYASYFGSKWYLGPNRTQITSNTDRFYKTDSEEYPAGRAGDAANFYAKNGVGPTPEDCGANGDYWVHIDPAADQLLHRPLLGTGRIRAQPRRLSPDLRRPRADRLWHRRLSERQVDMR